MSDWWLLQGVLVLMYLSECVRWVRPNCLMVEVRAGGSIRIRLPSYQLTLFGRLPVLLNPLTPWRANASAEVVPVCVSPSRIVAASCQELRPPPWPPEQPAGTAWDEIAGIWSEGSAIHAGSQVQAAAASEATAREYAAALRSIWQAPAEDRGQLIDEWLAEIVAPDEVARRIKHYVATTLNLRLWATILLLLMLLALPVSIAFLPAGRLPVLGCAVVAWAACLVSFALGARRLGIDRGWTTHQLLKLLLDPPAAARSADRLLMAALEMPSWNSLSILRQAAAVSCEDPVVLQAVRDLMHPVNSPANQPGGAGATQWFRTRVISRLCCDPQFVRTVEWASRPPPPDDTRVSSYCIRCHAQHVRAEGQCCLCHGSTLQRWPTP